MAGRFGACAPAWARRWDGQGLTVALRLLDLGSATVPRPGRHPDLEPKWLRVID